MTAKLKGGKNMKKTINWLDKYLSNNHILEKSNSLYRKGYVLNAILTLTLITSLLYAVLNIILFDMYYPALVNAIAAVLALLTLIYFKKTNNYKPAAYISVAILIFWLVAFFQVVQNKHYAFYWLVILPPIVYFLIERKAAGIVITLFGFYMLSFVLYNKASWSPSEFDAQSVFNIIGATLCLMLMLISFEKSRKEAWDTLRTTNLQLKNNQDELRLILDSAAEAIYGIDLNGNCTFCNRSCIQMLGYDDQTQLLGKNMHRQIHHTCREGAKFPVDKCRIYNAFVKGERTHVDDEIFWRADGSFFEVEYYSFPQISNGKVIGAVVTFRDISERKQREAEIKYLSCYDVLTGLHNRRCFEENREKIDNADNLPLSVIFADINGLKMTNDIFGHSAGDNLIKVSSEILRQVCRQGDVAARVGGDEFIILLPKTTQEDANKILCRIKSKFEHASVEAIKCSISLGLDTKLRAEQSLDEIMANAENAMYKDKTINRKAVNTDMIDTIINTLHKRTRREKQHSVNVAELCLNIGLALKLPETEISKLQRAGYLHDIGKIILEPGLVDKDILTDEEQLKMQQHSVVGYRILSLFDYTLDLAEYIYGHHERWDGKGYPRGLKAEEIPLISRIITVAETYERILNSKQISLQTRQITAIEKIKEGSGTFFDPNIVNVLVKTQNIF